MAAAAPNTSQDTKIRVAIIGAGIGGLTLSAALNCFDRDEKLEINLFEGANQISEVGAGIGIWPRTWEILKEIGLNEPLEQFLAFPPDEEPRVAWKLSKADETPGLFIQDIMMKGRMLGFHRADLHQTLLQRTSATKIHVKKRLSSIEEGVDGDVHIHFEDGTRASCDILVGMEGMKSMVRKELLVKQGLSGSLSFDPVWTGCIAYRGLVEKAMLELVFPEHRALSKFMLYVGKCKHLIVYPVQREDGEILVNVAAFATNLSRENTPFSAAPVASICSQEEILTVFSGWEPEVQALIQCMTRPMKWAVGEVIPLDSYASGRIFIGGDAAHAMPPHQGSGAGQAIEDAYILAKLLCHMGVTKAHISAVGEVYSAIRCPESKRVRSGSIRNGRLYQLLVPGFEKYLEGDTDIPFEKLQGVAAEIGKELEWTWTTSAGDDLKRALEMLSLTVQTCRHIVDSRM